MVWRMECPFFGDLVSLLFLGVCLVLELEGLSPILRFPKADGRLGRGFSSPQVTTPTGSGCRGVFPVFSVLATALR